MANHEPEIWSRSSLDTPEQYSAAAAELRRLMAQRPASGTPEHDQIAALHVLMTRYEVEQINATKD
jgi:hypothetical protein